MVEQAISPPPVVSGSPFALEPLGPSRHGSLEATVACHTSRTAGSSREHAVTIEADWSVSTPHDIELERVAMAMGGYLSCVTLVDREVPALRELLQLRARRVVPDITRTATGHWRLHVLADQGCRCHQGGFGTAAEAAEHARDPFHVARLHGLVPGRLARLLRAVQEAYGTGFYEPPADVGAAAGAVRERDGIERLWETGVHPEVIARLHEALWPQGPPMPVWFYLGAISRRPSFAWIARTLAAVPDEDVAVWLCWTDTELDRTHPAARAGWLQAGVPRNAITALADGAYTPADVARLAACTRRSVPRAAITLAAWHRAGCHPSPQDIALLDQLDGDPWYEPSAGAVDWLWNRAGNPDTGPTRTELAMLLAVCGTRANAMYVLDKGVRDPRVAARLMNDSDKALTVRAIHTVPVTRESELSRR